MGIINDVQLFRVKPGNLASHVPVLICGMLIKWINYAR